MAKALVNKGKKTGFIMKMALFLTIFCEFKWRVFVPRRYEKLWGIVSIRTRQEVFWGAEFTVCLVAGTAVCIKNIQWWRGQWIWRHGVHPSFSLPSTGPHLTCSGLFNQQPQHQRDWQLFPDCSFAGEVLHSPTVPSKAKQGCFFWSVVQWTCCQPNVLGCIFN